MKYQYNLYPERNSDYLHSMNLNSYDRSAAYTFDKRDARKSVSKLFLAATAYILIATILISIVEIGMIIFLGNDAALSLFSDPSFLLLLQVVTMYLIAFPIFLVMTKGLTRKSDFDYIERHSLGYNGFYEKMNNKEYRDGISFKEFIGLFFVCYSVMIFGSIISETLISILSGILGHNISNATSDLLLDTPIGIVILVAVVIGPIVEELMFRKVFIDVLGVYGQKFGIVLSSLAFGFFHGNLSQLLFATLLGFILGYIYTKTGRITLTIIMHMLVNFFGTVPTLLATESLNRVSEAELNGTLDSIATSDLLSVYGLMLMQYGFAIIGIIVFIKCIKNGVYSLNNECPIRIPASKVPRIAFFNLGVLCFYAFALIQILLSLTI